MSVVPQQFGDQHTRIKLDKVEEYLGLFGKVLQEWPFRRIYVDAFAGSGAFIPLGSSDANQLSLIETEDILLGSAARALAIDPPFDRYIFIDQSRNNVESLNELLDRHPEKADRIEIKQGDANVELAKFCKSLKKLDRTVVFLDPFGLSVKWETIKNLASTKAVDLWYLVPVFGMSRQVSEKGIEHAGAARIDEMLGTDEWRKCVIASEATTNLFGEVQATTRKIGGAVQLSDFVMERLDSVFEGGVSKFALPLGRKGRHEFSLVFACANPSIKANSLALRLATSVLKL